MSTFLSCEKLISGICSIGDYVIEWRLDDRDGEVVFISGEGADPQIQAFHPFVDEVVQSGTLYPIIQYAYLNGTKYTLEFEEGALHSPDFKTCLDPVVVESIDCSTVLGADPKYPFYLSYTNTVDIGDDKSRTFRFNLSSDTAYLAFEFCGFTVAEQMKIYYCTLLDPVGTLHENWIHGTNYVSEDLNPAGYPTNPKKYAYSFHGVDGMKYISDLTGFSYTVGDYLKIVITGSVYEPSNENTNWYIKLKCLTVEDIDCTDFYDNSISKIDEGSIEMAYSGDPSCVYTVSYDSLIPSPPV